MKDSSPIAIIGAGLGGLTAALAMLKLGVPARVYEQAPELGEVGAGITIQPNASRVLEYLGLGPAMDRWAVEPKTIGARHYKTGEILSIRDGATLRDSLGSRYCFMHRADMHQMLTDAVRAIDPDCIVLDHRVARVENRGQSAVAYFENGAAIEAPAIIGADGIHSVVRAQLWGKDNPTFAERVAWRALVPYDAIPAHALTPESAAIRGPDRFIVRYPVRARQLVNYVATMRYTGEWRVESWRERAAVDDVLEAFAGWDDCALDLLRATPPDGCYKWAIFAREPLPRWTDGHITLLGDAAHASQPYLGQGAA
ncbi:MAG: FAD-dependent monooxygenase, partial [Dehalococcoidia bacterium]|nr:FAD-dependent monooxygenase [Dehalococcoidia bacterium]